MTGGFKGSDRGREDGDAHGGASGRAAPQLVAYGNTANSRPADRSEMVDHQAEKLPEAEHGERRG